MGRASYVARRPYARTADTHIRRFLRIEFLLVCQWLDSERSVAAFARGCLGRFQVFDRVFRFLRASQLFFEHVEEVIQFSCRHGSGKTEMRAKKGNQSITADAYGLSTVRLDRPPDAYFGTQQTVSVERSLLG